jgi:hypothetical protein
VELDCLDLKVTREKEVYLALPVLLDWVRESKRSYELTLTFSRFRRFQRTTRT